MPRAPLHALIWSREQRLYELHTQGQLEQRFQPTEEAAWLVWLSEATSFAFRGPEGSLNVYLERRPRGGTYWYAYHTSQRRTHKRYLGRTENLSLARLEETARMLAHASRAAQSPGQGIVLLSSKHSTPRLPNLLVERERLLSALDRAFTTPLTLLSASAGFGKTTLLAAWASLHTTQVAWLSLDELDNTSTRFWVLLVAALQNCAHLTPQIGNAMVALLQSPQPPPLASCLSALIQDLESHEADPVPVVLVVDDYQIIADPAIHQSLAFWIEHLPAHLHLILSSRTDPDLPLARWRARGHLTEIRTDELRFSLQEAHHYLDQVLSPILSAEEVQQLARRTEGWIAGLHLTALALQKREDRAAFLQAFTGSQRYLLDYVQEEILARLPASVRDFLLSSAILSRLDASVCQAVTAEPSRAASQQMLLFLERANLFLVPLDEERRWYRLHDLLREALLTVLHTSQPELVPLLHRRAACFYEAQEEWVEAIAHALQAADFSTAARLMERTVEQFWLRGEATTMARWVLELPEILVREHARLLLNTALYLLMTVAQTSREQRVEVYQQMRQLMARVETTLQAQTDEARSQASATYTDVSTAEDAPLQRRLRLLHMGMVMSEATATGAYERLSALQQEIEEEPGRDEEEIWQIVPLTCRFVLHFTVWQTGAQLLPWLLEARERASTSASPIATIKVGQYLAAVAVEAGHLRLAYEEGRAALDRIEQIAGYGLLKGYFQVVLAQVLYQWNRLEEARGLLRTVLHAAATWQQLDLLGWGYTELMQVALATGDQALAEQALSEVEQLVQRERFATYPGWLPTMRAQWWLAQGRSREASDWTAGVLFPQERWEVASYNAFPVVMRVYFAESRWREALELLERWSEHLDRPANRRITITFLAQYMVALHQAGRSEQVGVVAARLFALTEPEGYLRVYLDEGGPMRLTLLTLLGSHSRPHELTSSTAASISRLLTTFEHEARDTGTRSLAIALRPAPSSVQQETLADTALDASLTRREQEVLRLLAAGASNQDIAQTLVISLNTVKKHVSNLLGKLGASSRTQAISLARARALL